jgi:effector-binding domain-containing protein
MEAINSFKVRPVNFRAKRYAVIQKELSIMGLENFFRESYEEIQRAMQSRGMRSAGAPAALYYRWDEQNMITDVAAAIPVYASLNVDEIKTVRIPSQKAYLVELYGPYSELVYAHKAMDLYLQKNDLQMKFPVIEEYVTDPSKETDSSKWLTKIYYFAE